MTKTEGRARIRLAEARDRFRKRWAGPRSEHRRTAPAAAVEAPAEPAASEASAAVEAAPETCEPKTCEAEPLETGPIEIPRPDPLAPMTRYARSMPPAVAAAALSRRDLMLAGSIAGVSGLAVGIMRLPVFNPVPAAPALAEAPPRLFDSPPSYLASDGFPDGPQQIPGQAPPVAVAEATPAAPNIAQGSLLDVRKLALFNENTGEKVSATYWAEGDYVLEELEAIHVLLRDHHAGEVRAMDLALVETLHGLGKTLETEDPLHILSAYRTRRTNQKLAERFHGVAVNSFHIKGKAVDVRVPGRSKRAVLKAALKLKAGGVGDYRRYVHLDTGPVRRWKG